MRPNEEFQTLMRRFSEGVYNHAWRMLGSREEAEEAAQDVFLQVHRAMGELRGEAQVSTWIWRITNNICLNRRESREYADGDRGESASPDDLIGGDPDPLHAVVQIEERERLARMIARLPDREASAITFYYIEGFDYVEIAGLLRIPAGSVATALHRGRERLRKMGKETHDLR